MAEIKKNTGNSNVSTSFLNGTVRASYNELVAIFGEPSFKNSPDGKTKAEWSLTYSGGLSTFDFFLYDWKECINVFDDPDVVIEWNIGASGYAANTIAVEEVTALLETNRPYNVRTIMISDRQEFIKTVINEYNANHQTPQSYILEFSNPVTFPAPTARKEILTKKKIKLSFFVCTEGTLCYSSAPGSKTGRRVIGNLPIEDIVSLTNVTTTAVFVEKD